MTLTLLLVEDWFEASATGDGLETPNLSYSQSYLTNKPLISEEGCSSWIRCQFSKQVWVLEYFPDPSVRLIHLYTNFRIKEVEDANGRPTLRVRNFLQTLRQCSRGRTAL